MLVEAGEAGRCKREQVIDSVSAGRRGKLSRCVGEVFTIDGFEDQDAWCLSCELMALVRPLDNHDGLPGSSSLVDALLDCPIALGERLKPYDANGRWQTVAQIERLILLQ